MVWGQSAGPEIGDRTAHVLLARDRVLARLTGSFMTDPFSPLGFVTPDFSYADPLITRLGGAAQRLASLADPLVVVGQRRAGWPFAGTPVVLGIMSTELFPQAGIITFPDSRGLRVHEAPQSVGPRSTGRRGFRDAREEGREAGPVNDQRFATVPAVSSG